MTATDKIVEHIGGTVDDTIRLVSKNLMNPHYSAMALAMALGRVAERCGLDLEFYLKVAREAHKTSSEVGDG